jgi:hypothetical protein
MIEHDSDPWAGVYDAAGGEVNQGGDPMIALAMSGRKLKITHILH